MDEIIKALSMPATIAVLTALATGAVALWQGRDKSKLEERADYISNIRSDSIKKDERITALEKRVGRLEAHLITVWRWAVTLESQLVRHNIPIPDGRPDPTVLFGSGERE